MIRAVQSCWVAIPILILTVGWLGACHQEPLDVVGDVSLAQFQGQWFEIAKLPRASQADCFATTASYALRADGRMVVTNQCRLGSMTGAMRTVTAQAWVPDPAAPGKLAVDFGGFFGDYWIIDLAPDYSYAVVGHPTREYLWILSRSPKLDGSVLSPILKRASEKGFDVSRLEYTAQSP